MPATHLTDLGAVLAVTDVTGVLWKTGCSPAFAELPET